MAKDKKTAPTKSATKKSAPKAAPTSTVEVKTEPTSAPVINPEILANAKTTGLDANHQVELLGLMSKHLTGPTAAEKYGRDVESKMDRIVAVGVVAALAEHAVIGDTIFASIVKKDVYPMLISVAKDMGITLPEVKLLPAGKESGTVEIPSDSIEIAQETAEQITKESETEKAGSAGDIELDPIKVAHMSEEDLKKALTYLFITSPKRNKFSVKEVLVSTVDFMHDYRIEQARQAENSTDAMNKLEDRTMYEWLADIKQYVEPTTIAKGIGKGLVNLTIIEKSPLSAFLTLRGSLIDPETKKVVWDDQSIADATKFFIEFICESEIAKENAAIELLDKKDKSYNDIVKKHKEVITRYESVMKNLSDVNFDICESTDENDANRKAFGRIWNQYYPECDAAERPRYVGLDENIRQRAGIILNLFRSPGNYNQLYSESNLVEITKMSMEDYMAKITAEKEKATAEKKAKAKNA